MHTHIHTHTRRIEIYCDILFVVQNLYIFLGEVLQLLYYVSNECIIMLLDYVYQSELLCDG